MKPVECIILTGFTLLLFIVWGVSPSHVHAITASERSKERPVYDGPCSSDKNALVLCRVSSGGLQQIVVVTPEPIKKAKPTSDSEPFFPSAPKMNPLAKNLSRGMHGVLKNSYQK